MPPTQNPPQNQALTAPRPPNARTRRPRGGVGRRAFPYAVYEALVEAFRFEPGNCNAAAKHAGIGYVAAKRGWELGWPTRGWLPIKQVLAEEQAEARKRVAELEAREKELSDRERSLRVNIDRETLRADALKRREDWARAATVSRGNAIASMGVQAELLRAALQQAANWKTQLQDPTLKMSPAAVVKLLKDLSSSILQSNEALKVAQQVEHLALGEPTDIFGMAGMGEADNPEAAAQDIDLAARALARARARGLVLPAAAKPVDTTVVGEAPRAVDGFDA